MKVQREKLFLRNQSLEQNPSNQRQTDLYKKVKDHIKKTGFIINPLLVVKDKNKYKIVYGNNRFLAGVELGLKEFPVEVLKDEEVRTIMKGTETYQEVNLDE